jgi:hypothetical protein
MNSTKGLGVNTECNPASFLQRRLSRLCIYSVKKHSGGCYRGYIEEITHMFIA